MTQTKQRLIVLFIIALLSACSEENKEMEKGAANTQPSQPELTSPTTIPEPQQDLPQAVSTPLSHDVVTMEEIYAHWPKPENPISVMRDQNTTKKAQQPEQPPAENTIHIINAEARVFRPDIIYIQPGDTVSWTNMTSHNTVSVEGLIPEGAKPWHSKLGENLKLQLNTEGIYAYVCQPHIGFGMVGLIVVGQPDNLQAITQYAVDNLNGPYRRLIGKLNKVTIPE